MECTTTGFGTAQLSIERYLLATYVVMAFFTVLSLVSEALTCSTFSD